MNYLTTLIGAKANHLTDEQEQDLKNILTSIAEAYVERLHTKPALKTFDKRVLDIPSRRFILRGDAEEYRDYLFVDIRHGYFYFIPEGEFHNNIRREVISQKDKDVFDFFLTENKPIDITSWREVLTKKRKIKKYLNIDDRFHAVILTDKPDGHVLNYELSRVIYNFLKEEVNNFIIQDDHYIIGNDSFGFIINPNTQDEKGDY